MFEDEEYTQHDLDLTLNDAQRHLTRLHYDQALELYLKARMIAWSLAATVHFTDLDRIIRRLRDQVACYTQLTALTKGWDLEADTVEHFAKLQQLEQFIGLLLAMDYQTLSNTARTMRAQFIATLKPEQSQNLAQYAADAQDYQLALAVLEGLQLSEGTAISALFKRVQGVMESEIAPFLQQAKECLTQSRPLEALGPLQDLRQLYPNCPAWRETWFAATRIQGEFFLQRGRRHISELEHKMARSTFTEASRAFSRGTEAYPEASSTKMLLIEAQDLRELAQDLGAAYALLNAHQESEAVEKFGVIYKNLLLWEDQQREYTQIKYELTLLLTRLQGKTESIQQSESTDSKPSQRKTILEDLANLAQQDPLAAIRKWQILQTENPDIGQLPIVFCESLFNNALTHFESRQYAQMRDCIEAGLAVCPNKDEFEQLRLRQGAEIEPDASKERETAPVLQDRIDIRRALRALRTAIENGDFQQGWEVLERLEASNMDVKILDHYEKLLQVGTRLDRGRQLFEKGEMELALVRFKSAAELASNMAEAELLASDAQMWLERTQSRRSAGKLSVENFEREEVLEIDSTVETPGMRLMKWLLNIEPVLSQARTAFVKGDTEEVHQIFTGLLKQYFTPDQG